MSSNICVYKNSDQFRGTLLPTAWLKVTATNGRTIKLRALIDQGSEVSLISRSVVQVRVKWKSVNVGVTGVAGLNNGRTFGCVQLQVSSTTMEGEIIDTNAIVLGNLTSPLPSQYFQRTQN